jgi:hypothetical protein
METHLPLKSPITRRSLCSHAAGQSVYLHFSSGGSCLPPGELPRGKTELPDIGSTKGGKGTIRTFLRVFHLNLIQGSSSISPLRLSRLIMVNAMANTAVMSSLPEDEFHDKSEGLGILCRLPARPTGNDSAALLQKLRAVVGVISRRPQG